MINIFYAEGKYGASFGDGFNAIAAAQFVAQNSTGPNLLNGGNYFATNQFGIKIISATRQAILTVGYSVVNPSFAIQTPWSANPFYTDAQIQAFNRAGEQALMVGLSYVFNRSACRAWRRRCSITTAGPGPPPQAPRWSRTSGTSISNGGRTGSRSGTLAARAVRHLVGLPEQRRTNVDEVRLILNYNIKIY